MLDAGLRRKLDLPLLLMTYLIALLGVVMVFSATRGDATAYHKKQIIWIVLGTGGLAVASLTDYHVWARFARHFYVLNLILLLLVKLPRFHANVNGAARWISIAGFQFQPSEFAKVFMILTLAIFLAKRQDTIRTPGTLLLSLAFIALPVLLIFRQPDLGTALVILAIWFGMTYIAGARLKHLGLVLLAGIVLFAVAWKLNIIKQFQKDRLGVFTGQVVDPRGIGYHITQARIAIGSGQMWGKGLMRSTQVRGGYVPEKQTDFIFTSVGEELGFLGGVFVTFLYGFMLLRGTQIIAAADEDMLGKLIAAGIVTMLAFHVIVNIGMNVGIMPVVGVPLPLISAGGSNMLATLFSIGLLQSISLHRHQLLF